MPDRSTRPGESRRPQYDLPTEYGPTRPGRPDYDGPDYPGRDAELEAEFDDVTVRAVHRDDVPDSDAAGEHAGAVVVADRHAADGDGGGGGVDDAGDVPAVGKSEVDAPLTRQDYVKQQSPTKPPRSARRKWITRGIAIALVIVLIPVAVSFVNYMRQPGTDSFAVRTVSYFRDHGADGFVNTIERWWYTNNPPPTGGTPDRIEVQGTSGTVAPSSGATVTT
ncbi:MAG: hypothetical protein ABW073_09625, partial [Acidimicrobiia bacterium]